MFQVRNVVKPVILVLGLATLAERTTEASDGLTLLLEPAGASRLFNAGDKVMVRVTLLNPAAGQSWVIVPRLVLGSGGVWPEPELRFRVWDAQGKEIPVPPPFSIDKRALPSLCAFTDMQLGTYFGRNVQLAEKPFGPLFPEPGHFRVRAVVEIKARQWLERAIEKGYVSSKDVHFPIDRVADTVLESQDLEIEVR